MRSVAPPPRALVAEDPTTSTASASASCKGARKPDDRMSFAGGLHDAVVRLIGERPSSARGYCPTRADATSRAGSLARGNCPMRAGATSRAGALGHSRPRDRRRSIRSVRRVSGHEHVEAIAHARSERLRGRALDRALGVRDGRAYRAPRSPPRYGADCTRNITSSKLQVTTSPAPTYVSPNSRETGAGGVVRGSGA